ncbi:MAG: metallophosphoesterase family protein, partial [Anaerolineales bacterium]|nr:metallophosphoesterase family protein [Anaerolineales bacterium]
WTFNKLSKADLNYLKTYQSFLKFKLAPNITLLCYHGSPRSNVENIFAVTPPELLDEMLDGYTSTIMAGGHTHVQMMRQHNGILIVNAGSVGMPFEQMPFKDTPRVLPWAEYTILNLDQGRIGVELCRIPIDIELVKQAALDSGMPETRDWIKNWVSISSGSVSPSGHTRALGYSSKKSL